MNEHCLLELIYILIIYEIYFQEEKSRASVGDIFQDEDNMAAILMRKHLETGDLIMVSADGLIIIN